jgi:diguanylate cyclase (GGDEF)-like protein
MRRQRLEHIRRRPRQHGRARHRVANHRPSDRPARRDAPPDNSNTLRRSYPVHLREALRTCQRHLTGAAHALARVVSGIDAVAKDGTTQLALRDIGREALLREVARAHRNGNDLSLVLLDLDNFKRFNSGRRNHKGGDAVLAAVGSIVRANVRAADAAARWGIGDELLAILPGASASSAVATAERIRSAVQALNLGLGAVTASIGVATLRRREAADALLVRADAALRRAKEKGKNCVST